VYLFRLPFSAIAYGHVHGPVTVLVISMSGILHLAAGLTVWQIMCWRCVGEGGVAKGRAKGLRPLAEMKRTLTAYSGENRNLT